MKIFVTGGLSTSSPEDEAAVRALGKAIASAGHTLLQGHYNNFDRLIAAAAFEAAKESGRFANPRLAVQSFLTKDQDPPEGAQWLVRKLSIRDWDPGEERWSVPEPVQFCDVVMVMGGGPKTLRAANLSRLAHKPLVPITALGGAAVEVFETELRRFSEFYEGRVSRDQYSLLDTQNRSDFDTIAREAVLLASQLSTGNTAFIVMTFREESEDTWSTIEAVCEKHKLEPDRTDKDPTTDRIYQRIASGIRRASVVIADVTFPSLNVYYELGFAEALGKHIIVVAKQGTELPFDTRDIPTMLFQNQTRLREALDRRLENLIGMNAKGVG